MHVEVNEQNIILFGLVQLTGNSAEEMLAKAAEAREEGYTLTCEIPSIAEDLIKVNMFDAAGSEEADPNLGHEAHPLDTGVETTPGRVINITSLPPKEDDDED